MGHRRGRGHEVDEKGIHTVYDKIAAVAKFPQPKTVENVRSFLRRPYMLSFYVRFRPVRPHKKKKRKEATHGTGFPSGPGQVIACLH